MGGQNILTIFSAILTALVFPKVEWYLLSYICLIPFIIDLEKSTSAKSAAFKGWLFGVVFMAWFHNWIFELKAFSPAVAVLFLWGVFSAYLGLFYAGAAWVYHQFKSGLTRIFFLPACFVAAEWLRTLGPLGDSGGAMGYSQTHVFPILQWAGVTGVYGLSFLCIVANLLILGLFSKTPKRYVVSLAALCVIIFGIGALFLHNPDKTDTRVKVAVIQGNHAQNIKENNQNWDQIFQDYGMLSCDLRAGKVDLMFWPETILPILVLQNQVFTKKLCDLSHATGYSLIFGIPIKDGRLYYNGLAAVTPAGLSRQIYKKNHLMPFGEFIPGRSLLGFFHITLPGTDYSPGHHDYTPLVTPVAKIGGGICLEANYPTAYRKSTVNGADILSIHANNAWFFNGSAAPEMLQMGILRAVENNRFLVLAANTGISAVIDNKGRVVTRSQMNHTQVLRADAKTGLPKSPYTAMGDVIVLISGLLIGIAMVKTRPNAPQDHTLSPR